jgi:peroxiredoxin Q/BCP
MSVKLILLVLFFIWGIPLVKYRSDFRKIVYQADSWTINIKPYFIKETKALFVNIYPGNEKYLEKRNFYRKYLLIYVVLFALYIYF